ncbi:MAG: PhnD/SsuA/transferrin family substrate-binding protein [Betaproteobacteria bacterium]|nr:PhnD/SsuA/transferrin family substrate-binding protein [Betaproteobacteria bacterium]
MTRLFATALLGLLLCLRTGATPAAESVTLGSVAMDIPVEMIKRMSALSNYLAMQTGLNVHFRPSPNLSSAVDDLGAGRTQIAYLTPVAYIEARKKYGAIPLVAPTTRGKPHLSLVLVTKAGSGIDKPAQLKGKRFAFGDEKALLQKAAVASFGLGTGDFAEFAYLKHYDNIAKAVLAGDFDGGILKDSIAEEFRYKGLAVVGSTAPLASYVFAAHPKLPAKTRQKLRDALLALKKDGPDKTLVLEAFDVSYDGFVPIQDKDYDSVRKLIEPFQK